MQTGAGNKSKWLRITKFSKSFVWTKNAVIQISSFCIRLAVFFFLKPRIGKSTTSKTQTIVAVLYPGGAAGKFMAERLKAHAIPCVWLANSEYKKRYDPDSGLVNLMAMPRSKGVEFDTAAMLVSGHIPHAEQVNDEPRPTSRFMTSA